MWMVPSIVDGAAGAVRHYGVLVELGAMMLATNATVVTWSSAAIALSIAALAFRRAL